MTSKLKYSLLLFFLLCSLFSSAQRKVNYELGASASISTQSSLPFWLVSNKNGIVPNKNNALIDASVFSDFSSKGKSDFNYSFGVELVGSKSNEWDLLFQQAFGSFQWNQFQLDLGVKDNPIEMDGLSSANGNILYSGNARSIPRIAISTPEYIPVPFLEEWFAVKGLYSEGLLNDERFVDDTRVHYKNVFIKFGGDRRINFVLGFHHYSQWAGTSKDPKYGKLASDFKNYLNVIQAKGGTDESNFFEWENSIGNHIGGWDYQVHYQGGNFEAELYRQTLFEDHSGIYMTRPDGITGLYVKLKGDDKLVSSFLYENYYTKYQSGSSPGGSPKPDGGLYTGQDNYFNNGIYRSGWTYFGRTIGSPFFLTNAESEDGITLGISNNRFVAHHFGLAGKLFHTIPYRAKFSYTQNWGTYSNPNEMKEQISWVTEFELVKSKFPFKVSFTIAGDHGDLLENNLGFFIRIARVGIL